MRRPDEVVTVTVCPSTPPPSGFSPTTVPAGARLSTVAVATAKPAFRRAAVARSAGSPITAGIVVSRPPVTNRGSGVGNGWTGLLPRIGVTARYQVRAGVVPPKRLPVPHDVGGRAGADRAG